MTGNFETFDKAPATGVIKFRQWRFAWREIILVGVALLLLVLCLVFACLYGLAEWKMSDQTQNPSVVIDQHYCVNQTCLQTASRTLQLMNTSVDPCEDFYHYACGNYKNVKTASYGDSFRTVLGDIHLDNENRLTEVVEKPIDRTHEQSSERKLKEFFQSCTDMYSREKLLGRPFLEKVVPALGGWDLLGTWNEAHWDFNTALKNVQVDFWTKAIYKPTVRIDRYESTRYAIELEPAGTGKWLHPESWLNPSAQRVRDHYQKFIRRVASLLMRDSKLTFDPDTQATKLDQFVNDTFTMETNVAHAMVNNYCHDGGFQKITLNDLKTQTNSVINWVDHLSYLLSEATVTGSTEVVIRCSNYFKNLTTMITNQPNADRKRMLHNYLIWRVAEIYSQEMSWEYIHANREIYEDFHGYARFSGVSRYCFSQMGTYMSDALGVLFISDHFFETNRQQVKDITEHLKTVLQEQLDQTPWMDAKTKAYAKDKLDATSFKMGYPDWMANYTSVDTLYDALAVNKSDYFGNVFNARRFVRVQWSQQLMQRDDRRRWTLKIYDDIIDNIWYWNEIIAPAGILQNPIYDYTQPHYKTFGSLGGLLGRHLHNVVDDHGRSNDKEGNDMGDDSWWTYQSTHKYEKVKQCVADVYRDATTGLRHSDGTLRLVGFKPVYYASYAISTINGIRLALKGYRKWVLEQNIEEKRLPGIDHTDDQMVFLSYAQVACYDRSDFWSFLNAIFAILDEDLQVNIALSQLPEFSEAFKCKKTAKMNAGKKCDYY